MQDLGGPLMPNGHCHVIAYHYFTVLAQRIIFFSLLVDLERGSCDPPRYAYDEVTSRNYSDLQCQNVRCRYGGYPSLKGRFIRLCIEARRMIRLQLLRIFFKLLEQLFTYTSVGDYIMSQYCLPT